MITGLIVVTTVSILFSIPCTGQDKIVIDFWAEGNKTGWDPIQRELIKEYQQLNPGVEINYLTYGLSAEEQTIKLLLNLSRQQGPDLYSTDFGTAFIWYYNGWTASVPADLEEYFREHMWRPSLLDQFTYKGELYALPRRLDWTLCYYNADMFEEAGLADPPENWTWDDFIEYAGKLTEYDENDKVTRAGWTVRKRGYFGGIHDKWLQFFASAGGDVPYDYERAYIDTQPGIDALQLYVDAIHKYRVDSLELDQDFNAFGKGLAAMLFRGAWLMGHFAKNFPDINYKTTINPKKVGSSAGPVVQAWQVNKWSSNVEETYNFVEWWFQPAQQKRFDQFAGDLPIIKEAKELPFFAENPNYQSYFRQPEVISLMPHLRWSEITNIVGKYIELACYDKIGVEEALDTINYEIEEILAATEL